MESSDWVMLQNQSQLARKTTKLMKRVMIEIGGDNNGEHYSGECPEDFKKCPDARRVHQHWPCQDRVTKSVGLDCAHIPFLLIFRQYNKHFKRSKRLSMNQKPDLIKAISNKIFVKHLCKTADIGQYSRHELIQAQYIVLNKCY